MKNIFEGPTVYREPRQSHEEVEVERVMADVAKDMEVLLMKLETAVNAHEYQVVLGIDGGGRIPGLLLGSILKKIYKTDGASLPKTTFIAGFRAPASPEKRKADLQRYFSLPVFQVVKQNEKKVLITEDVIHKGGTLADIKEALVHEGIQYDIVTLSKYPFASQPGIFANVTRTLLHGKRVMSGVHKDKDELFSQTLRRPLKNDPDTSKTSAESPPVSEQEVGGMEYASDSEVLHRTRELVEAYAEELARKFMENRLKKSGESAHY